VRKTAIKCLCFCVPLCYCLAVRAAAFADDDAANSRIVAPIRQTVLPDGAIRYSIGMRINGQMFQVLLDSGSTGLRLMPAAVARLRLEPSGVRARYRFASGVVLRGTIVKVKAAVGAAGQVALLAQAVNSVSCGSARPHCAASEVSGDRFRIGADGFMSHGFLAILGDGLRPAGIPNPLAVIGKGGWIIDLPLPADRHPGRLILDPGQRELARYTAFPLQRERLKTPTGNQRGWKDTIPGCLANEGSARPICRPMILDTATMGFHVLSNRVAWPTSWPAGSRVSLVFKSPDTGSSIGFEFRSGWMDATKVFMAPSNRDRPAPPINCGAMPFYYFSVVYDAVNGVIGLKARRAPLL
jgi:hypothetical protein